jgi:hypothetical protein
MGRIAAECVALVRDQFGQDLDWSMASLARLDQVCMSLLAEGPLAGERLELWWQLVGAYTGEVVIRAYRGEWVAGGGTRQTPAILALGITGFPFATARRVLSGEPGKSLASFARAVPAISSHSRRHR